MKYVFSSSLKDGDRVTRGQEIGKVKTNNTNDKSRMLHLEVYYNRDKSGKQLTNQNGKDLTDTTNTTYWYVSLPSSGLNYQRRADLIDPGLVTQLNLIEDFK